MRTIGIIGIGHDQRLVDLAMAVGRKNHVEIVVVDDSEQGSPLPKLEKVLKESMQSVIAERNRYIVATAYADANCYYPDTQERRKPNQPFYMSLPKYKRRNR